MIDPGRFAAPFQSTRNLHQASQVAAQDHLRPGVFDSGDLVVRHAGGYLRILDAEGPPETTADFRIVHFLQLDSRTVPKKLPGLLPNAQFPQTRTGVVVRNFPVAGFQVATGHAFQSHFLHQKLGQFKRLFPHRPGPCVPVPFRFQQRWVMMPDHRRTGPRRHDNTIEWLQGPDDRLGQFRGFFLVPAVVRGLAATALQRHGNRASALLQQLNCRKSDFGPKQVCQAGDKQSDVWARCGGHQIDTDPR